MKTVLILLLCIPWLIPKNVSAQKSSSDSISVTILLKNKNLVVDSVFIIFDRYDLTGAGVIKNIYYPSRNQVVIEKVPKGKYYVDVHCIGIGHQNYTKVSTIGRRRSNKVTVPLETYGVYIPGTAIIPASIIDINNLVVTQNKSFK